MHGGRSAGGGAPLQGSVSGCNDSLAEDGGYSGGGHVTPVPLKLPRSTRPLSVQSDAREDDGELANKT